MYEPKWTQARGKDGWRCGNCSYYFGGFGLMASPDSHETEGECTRAWMRLAKEHHDRAEAEADKLSERLNDCHTEIEGLKVEVSSLVDMLAKCDHPNHTDPAKRCNLYNGGECDCGLAAALAREDHQP